MPLLKFLDLELFLGARLGTMTSESLRVYVFANTAALTQLFFLAPQRATSPDFHGAC